MSNTFEYKGRRYTFYRGWGLDSDVEIVKAFLEDRKLPEESYCVIVHDGADPDNKRHQQVVTFSGLRSYWGDFIHRGPFFHDELGNDYQTFVSHAWRGESLTHRQKKHIQDSFENFVYKMRNVKSIHFYYQDVIETERHKLKFSFYEYSGDEEDRKVLNAFKFGRSLENQSYCAIKYNGKGRFHTSNLVFRHETFTPMVYNGPAFHDDEGNDYEIIISRKWKGEKLTQDQQEELQKAFQERVSDRKYVDFVEYHWQTGTIN